MKKSIMFSALNSGSGKTLITYGVTKYFTDRGFKVRVFKTGPDYIDPLYHSIVSKNECINLEPYFLEDEKAGIKKQFEKYSKDADICIIEGAMGYYSGVYKEEPRASAYTVARELGSEVCLVITTKSFDEIKEYVTRYGEAKESLITSVILNRYSKKEYELIGCRIKEELGIEVIGYLDENEEFEMSSRHLGLHIPKKKELLKQAARVRELMDESVDLSYFDKFIEEKFELAVAKDEAFCFMYEENLEILKNKGAKISFFSPLRDKLLPKTASGLWLCGGYPEIFAEVLSKNKSLLNDIKEKILSGMPTIAECGGFMYLHDEIEAEDGKVYKCAGVFEKKAFRTDRLQRFGYIEVKAKYDNLLLKKGESFKSHEFHYWDSENPGESCEAIKANKSKTWDCIAAGDTLFAGFPHIYLAGNENMAINFANRCIAYKNEISKTETLTLKNSEYIRISSEEELESFVSKIEESNKNFINEAKRAWDKIAKPLNGLGKLEALTSKLAGISESIKPDIKKRCIFVFCADNGVVEEGVSQVGSEVTAEVAYSLVHEKTSVNSLSFYNNTEVIPIDIGIKKDLNLDGLINKKVAYGTKNILKEAAMSKKEALKAIETGINLVYEYKKQGYTLIGTGEMGIGNTTTSAAVSAVLLGLPAKFVTGRGAGLSDAALERKKYVIERAIKRANLSKDSLPLDILAELGGLDIAALCGVFLAGAYFKIPIIADGFISLVSALLATRMNKNCTDYILESHKSKEPAAGLILEELKLNPILDGDFCLGEGMGAALLISLLEQAFEVYNNSYEFDDIGIEEYKSFK